MSATHNYIKKIITDNFGSKKINIVDYGCGSGELLNHLEKKSIKNYCGFEVGDDCLDKAQASFQSKKIDFKKINKKKLPRLGYKKSVDLIVSVGVLQYMSDKEINYLLKEAKRVLTKNGIIVLSCAVDHRIYKAFNLYQFLIPNHYINRKKILNKIKNAGFSIDLEVEKGLLIAPLFSNIFSLFFDGLDRVIFKTKGTIGPIGIIARKVIKPFIMLEYKLPIDFGYTFYIGVKQK